MDNIVPGPEPERLDRDESLIGLAKQRFLRGGDLEQAARVVTRAATGQGCEEMQGYLFSLPLPKDELFKLVRTRADV